MRSAATDPEESWRLSDANRATSSSSSYYINDRQHSGSLSNVLSRLAVGVRVDGDDETLELELELGQQANPLLSRRDGLA